MSDAIPKGGRPVGRLEDLEPLEAGAVLYLRLWCDGQQAKVARDFALALGADHGEAATEALRALCDTCARHGRRPLMRHHLTCACIGADEGCFAHFVATAALGEREDALLMATLLVRCDFAPFLAGLAQDLGLALRRMALQPQGQMQTPLRQAGARLH